MKKIFPIFSLIIVSLVASILFIAPAQLFAPTTDPTYNHQLTVGFAGETTTIGFWGTGYGEYYKFITLYNNDTSEQIDFELASYTFINPVNPSEGVIQNDPWDIQMSNMLAAGNYRYNLIISEDWDILNSEACPIEPILLNEVHYFTVNAKNTAQLQTWIRTMPMTCYRVWINEDNNFQFIFWHPYRDNNWVMIYDMAGNEVFKIDLPYDNPNLIVDLPNGMYTVKTFTVGSTEPIQTFIIGKP